MAAARESLDSTDSTHRLATALEHLRIVLSEDMREVEARVRFYRVGFRAMPCYVSDEGCPPDLEECPAFYGL